MPAPLIECLQFNAGVSIDGGLLCAELGPAKICATIPVLNPDDYAIGKQLIAMLNSALLPYQPMIQIGGALLELFNCVLQLVNIIKDTIPGAPDPLAGPLLGLPKIFDLPAALLESVSCLNTIRVKINEFLKFMPPRSVFQVMRDAGTMAIVTIGGLVNQLRAIFDAQLLAIQRGLRINKMGAQLAGGLQLTLDCQTNAIKLELDAVVGEFTAIQGFLAAMAALVSVVQTAASESPPDGAAAGNALTNASDTFQNIQSTEAFETFVVSVFAPFDLLVGKLKEFTNKMQEGVDGSPVVQI